MGEWTDMHSEKKWSQNGASEEPFWKSDDNVGTRIIHIHTVLEGFEYPCETRYPDFAWVYGISHLKSQVGGSIGSLTLIRSQKILTLMVFWGLFRPQTLTDLPTINY